MDLDAARYALEKGIKSVANTGMRVDELRRGYVKCTMPFAGNVNHVGTMYAGALFTVAEIPGGAVFLSSFDVARYYPIVKALDLKFLKPARSDVSVEVTLDESRIAAINAEVEANGKAEFVLDAELRTADGTVVATSHGTYQIRRMGK